MRTQREVRQRAPWWLVGLLSLNLGLMSFYAQDEVTKQSVIRAWAQAAASLFQRPVATVGGASTGFFRRIGSLRQAATENEELKRRVAEIETELHETRAARDENERLKGLLALKEEAGYGVVPAHVIARHIRPDLRELRPAPEHGRAMITGEHPLDPPANGEVERPQQHLRQRPRAGAIRRAKLGVGCCQAAAAPRRRSSSGTATASITASRIRSAGTSSASAW